MLFFVVIILAGYLSVKCDDASNYYVIEMPTDVTTIRSQKPFNVYWNVPSMQCKSKKIPFNNLYEKYGIIQNNGDSFRGEKVAILYDPGLFPALLTNETSGKFKFRNGGVPQEGNITSHLDAFKSTVEQSIPDEKFDGIGIIDFESWRPVFRQNFGVLVPYKDVSVQIEKKLHWWWPKTWLQDEAKDRFEEAARQFMQRTVSVAKQLRPRARWGYYGFPYCFNVATNNPGEACPANVIRENNQIKWLWSESTALYPSIYSSVNLTSKQLTWLVRGRVGEAARVGGGGPILPYFWFRYRDAGFMTEDLDTVLKTLYKSEASGFIIWGSSNDVNTVNKCNKLLEYVNKTLGPAIAKYVKYGITLDDESTTVTSESDNVETTTNNLNETEDNLNFNVTNKDSIETQNKTINIKLDNVSFQIDPFFSQEYEGNIVQEVEDELNKKSEYNISEGNKDIENNEKQDIIEIFMNLMNSKSKTELKDSNYTSVPFLQYLMPDNTEIDQSKTTVKLNNEINIESTTEPFKYNDYDQMNTILYELNNLVGNKSNENYQTTQEYTDLDIQEKKYNEVTTENLITKIYTTEFESDEIFDTTKYTESTFDNNEMYTDTTETTNTTDTTETVTVSVTTEKVDTETVTVSVTTEKVDTEPNIEESNLSPSDTENFKTTETNIYSYDEITEITISEDLESKISKNTNEDFEFNYTAYSLPSIIPDKVVVYVL